MIELVLGGARSGKSRYAEQQAIESAKQVIYIATAEAGDAEMRVRLSDTVRTGRNTGKPLKNL